MNGVIERLVGGLKSAYNSTIGKLGNWYVSNVETEIDWSVPGGRVVDSKVKQTELKDRSATSNLECLPKELLLKLLETAGPDAIFTMQRTSKFWNVFISTHYEMVLDEEHGQSWGSVIKTVNFIKNYLLKHGQLNDSQQVRLYKKTQSKLQMETLEKRMILLRDRLTKYPDDGDNVERKKAYEDSSNQLSLLYAQKEPLYEWAEELFIATDASECIGSNYETTINKVQSWWGERNSSVCGGVDGKLDVEIEEAMKNPDKAKVIMDRIIKCVNDNPHLKTLGLGILYLDVEKLIYVLKNIKNSNIKTVYIDTQARGGPTTDTTFIWTVICWAKELKKNLISDVRFDIQINCNCSWGIPEELNLVIEGLGKGWSFHDPYIANDENYNYYLKWTNPASKNANTPTTTEG